MAARTFAICTANMNGLEFIFRISKVIAKCNGVAKILFKSYFSDTVVHRELAIEIIQGLSKSHKLKEKKSSVLVKKTEDLIRNLNGKTLVHILTHFFNPRVRDIIVKRH